MYKLRSVKENEPIKKFNILYPKNSDTGSFRRVLPSLQEIDNLNLI